MKRLHTSFLIASGARARWIEHQAGKADFVTVAEIAPEAIHTPRGPRHVSFESTGRIRHGPEEKAESERRREDFARQLARDAEARVRAGKVERLALVAPARLLRLLRDELNAEARARIVFELGRDLTKHPNHELGSWLAGADLSPGS